MCVSTHFQVNKATMEDALLIYDQYEHHKCLKSASLMWEKQVTNRNPTGQMYARRLQQRNVDHTDDLGASIY